ncbi:MAG: hypothetical protein ACLR93_04170 [Alistipes onderdonkii]
MQWQSEAAQRIVPLVGEALARGSSSAPSAMPCRSWPHTAPERCPAHGQHPRMLQKWGGANYGREDYESARPCATATS